MNIKDVKKQYGENNVFRWDTYHSKESAFIVWEKAEIIESWGHPIFIEGDNIFLLTKLGEKIRNIKCIYWINGQCAVILFENDISKLYNLVKYELDENSVNYLNTKILRAYIKNGINRFVVMDVRNAIEKLQPNEVIKAIFKK
jgi:hypothetical protein